MFVVLVWLTIHPERFEEFMAATLEMAHASFNENGCLRFEVLRGEADPFGFALYAAFHSAADAAAHFETEHFAQWNGIVAPMLSAPPKIANYNQLF